MQTESLEAGVQCARSHSGTEAHAEAMARGKAMSASAKLGHLPAEDISNLCGQCHRTFADVVRNRLFGQINVRFQPYRLAKSKCYDGSDSRISCTACHDPHRELVGNDESYDAKCQSCHAAQTAKKCKVAKAACVSCHMPKLELAGAHQTFTDHFIRVVRSNEVYPE